MVAVDNPGMKSAALMQESTKQWAALSNYKKSVFTKLATADKARFAEHTKEQNTTSGKRDVNGNKKKTKALLMSAIDEAAISTADSNNDSDASSCSNGRSNRYRAAMPNPMIISTKPKRQRKASLTIGPQEHSHNENIEMKVDSSALLTAINVIESVESNACSTECSESDRDSEQNADNESQNHLSTVLPKSTSRQRQIALKAKSASKQTLLKLSSQKRSIRSSTKGRVSHLPPLCSQTQVPEIQQPLVDVMFEPYETSPYPADYHPAEGDAVVLVLQPYRELIASITQSTALASFSDLNAVCKYNVPILTGKISAVKQHIKQPQANLRDYKTYVTIATSQGSFTILYLPFSSPLLTGETYFILQHKYRSSLKSPWMVVNAQVKRPLASRTGTGVLWLEGNIYYIGNIDENPYRSVLVAWVGLEGATKEWSYRIDQTDNECSPWDLHLSSFAVAALIRPREFAVVKMTPPKLNAQSIVQFAET